MILCSNPECQTTAGCICQRLTNDPDHWVVRQATLDAQATTISQLQAEIARLRKALEPLTVAAYGLSGGTDWNNGTHAKLHGYRQKLLDAIPAARAALGGSND